MIKKALEFVIDIEGKDTNDPNDPGGLTRFGIAQNYNPDVDVANLTLDGAVEVYRRKYWTPCKCDQLSSTIAFIIFDIAVNQGTDQAIRLLQLALNVQVDGIIGPNTLMSATKRSSSRESELEFARELTVRRVIRYANTKNFTIYGLGWVRRAVECLFEAQKA